MFRYAWHLLGRREDAEDASQATFLAVHRALSAGTAVLEPAAWVLGIARNECLGRLRRHTELQDTTALEAVEAPAAGRTERRAEVRAQIRVAHDTLRALPVPEREAFVLREWLGLHTAEVALAMNLTSGEIESLTGRARRSLVLAVGGLEPTAGCADTRAGLEAGSLGRAATVHLLRCPMCRGVRRALRPPGAESDARAPIEVVGQRLAGALPGFASGGGGIVALLTAKAAAAPLLAKTAALVTAALVTAGVAQHEIHTSARAHRTGTSVPARGGASRLLAPVHVVRVAPIVHAPAAPVVASKRVPQRQIVVLRVPVDSPRGGPAASIGGHASSTPGSTTGSRGPGSTQHGSDGGGAGASSDDHGSGTGSGSSSGSGDKGRDGGADTQAPTTTTTHTSGRDDGSSDAQRASGKDSSDDGSRGAGPAAGVSTYDGSGSDGGGSGGDDPVTTTSTLARVGGDQSSHGGDGGGGSDGSTSGGDGPPATTTATAPAAPAPASDD